MAPMFTRSTPTDKAINVRRQLKNTKKETQKSSHLFGMHEKIYDSLYTIHSTTKEQSIFSNGCWFFRRSELPFLPLAIFPSLNQYKQCESIDYKIKSERKKKTVAL